MPVIIPENTAGGFERFFESWRDMLLESYDDSDTYAVNPTNGGLTVSLYGSMIFRLLHRTSAPHMFVPATVLKLPNAPQPSFAPVYRMIYKGSSDNRMLDGYAFVLDATFDFNAFTLWSKQMKAVMFRSLGSDVFGCCNDFERCSDAGACLHPHEVFYNN